MKTKSFLRFAGLAGWLLLLVLSFGTAVAQTVPAQTPEMADGLRASGKIYVVVAVVAVIVGGLLLYLIALDRKVSRLEQEIKK